MTDTDEAGPSDSGQRRLRKSPRARLKRLASVLAEYDVLLEAFYFFGGIAIAIISVWLVLRQLDQVNVQIVQANNLTWEQAIDNRLTVLLEKSTEQFSAQCITMARPEPLHKACRKLYRESPEAVAQALTMATGLLDAIQEARSLSAVKRDDPKLRPDPLSGADHDWQIEGWIAALETDPFGLVRWLMVYNGFGDEPAHIEEIGVIGGMRLQNIEAGAAAFEQLLVLDPGAPLEIPPGLRPDPETEGRDNVQ